MAASMATLALHDIGGEAEQVASQKLGLAPLVVVVAARKTWRRSLTEKPEQRMLAEAYPDRCQGECSSIQNRAPMQVSNEILQELMPAICRSRGGT